MKLNAKILAMTSSLVVMSFSSCNWTGGSDSDFNTSRGSLNVNISGFYTGVLGGGRAVSQTSGGAISSLAVQQSGNVVEVRDSNGQTYRGNVGSPLALASVTQGGTLPVGAQLANFQVNWSGKDGVAARDINFVGFINLVSVTDIQGRSDVVTDTNTDASTKTSSSDIAKINQKLVTGNSNVTNAQSEGIDGSQTVNLSGGGTAVEVVTDLNSSGSQVVTTSSNGSTNNSASSKSSSNGNNKVATSTIQNTFALDNSNTQFRLRGTWIEDGGVVGTVDAVAAGAGGALVVLSTGEGSTTVDAISGGGGN